jgi:hypothetical protein
VVKGKGAMNMTRMLWGFCVVLLLNVSVMAGNAHFVGAPVFTISGNTATVSGKVAGLGNVPQIHVTFTGEAQCVNPGNNEPSAGNKQAFSAGGDFPVQNGRSYFALDLTAVLQPPCSPPMHISWSDLSIVVTADDGTFLLYP